MLWWRSGIHDIQEKTYNRPGRRLVMKIQSVTLNRGVSLAMNLLEGATGEG